MGFMGNLIKLICTNAEMCICYVTHQRGNFQLGLDWVDFQSLTQGLKEMP